MQCDFFAGITANNWLILNEILHNLDKMPEYSPFALVCPLVPYLVEHPVDWDEFAGWKLEVLGKEMREVELREMAMSWMVLLLLLAMSWMGFEQEEREGKEGDVVQVAFGLDRVQATLDLIGS